MIALNASLHSDLGSFPPPPPTSWGKGKKPCAGIYPSFYKKSVYRWTISANIILSPSVTKNLWCMAVLWLRIMASGRYRDDKFSFLSVWAWGSPETLAYLFGVTSVF